MRRFSILLATLPLKLACGFIPTSACGSSTGVCSWGSLGGLGSAALRSEHEGSAAAWITGIPAATGGQGTQQPQAPEVGTVRISWFLAASAYRPISIAHCLRHSKGPPTLGIFSTGRLPALAFVEREVQWWFHSLHMTQRQRPASMAAQRSSKSTPNRGLSPHGQQQSVPWGCCPIPMFSSSQPRAFWWPCVPVQSV